MPDCNRRTITGALAVSWALLLVTACATSGPPPADRVLLNGAVYTVDDSRSRAEALAIRDGEIVFVGSSDSARDYIGSATRVDDLNGRMVLPGFVDSHAHVIAAGMTASACNLADIRVSDGIRKALLECGDDPRFRNADWVIGARWALAAFENGMPPIAWLDDIFDGKPAYFVDSFGHSAWVSSRALAIAGITADTPDPDGGVIERDASTGEPNGVLRDTAMNLVAVHLPPETDQKRRDGIRAGQRETARFGITAYTEPGLNAEQAAAYKAADAAGELKARVLISLSPKGWHTAAFGDEVYDLVARREEFRGDYVKADSVKIYMDGVIETNTSYMLEPYHSGPENFPTFYTQEAVNVIVQRLDALGIQVHTHAIGDGAIRVALNAYEHAREQNGATDNRHQITHLQLIDEADIPRFGELGVAADFQSLWAYPDEYIDVAIDIVGEERVNRFYPIASVHESGGLVIGGSDWDVSSLNPLEAIEVAVTRRDPWSNAGPALREREAVTLETMIDAYTRNGAWVMKLDDRVGSLEVGKRADLVVLDRDLFAIPASDISDVQVDLTLMDGKEVYSRDAAEQH